MTTCIDTLEISYPLSHHEISYVSCRLDALTHASDEALRNRFLSTDPVYDNNNVMEYERFYRFMPGITRIKLLKYRKEWAVRQVSYAFKIFLWLKPELLVTGQYTLQLFRCSPANYLALQEAYAAAIYELFPLAFEYAPLDPQLGTYPEAFHPSGAYINQNLSRLPYLGLCQIERLDVTKDILVGDAAQFEPEAVIKGIEGMRDKVETSFIVDNMEYLYRNGRVSKAVYLLMKNSNIHPVIALKHGRMTVAGMFLGDLDKCYAKYVKSLFARHRDVDHSAVFVTHVGLSAKERYKIKETMARYVEFERIYEVHASGAISSNSGPGSVGVLFIKK